jgi:hypothetical protein
MTRPYRELPEILCLDNEGVSVEKHGTGGYNDSKTYLDEKLSIEGRFLT